MEPKGSVCYDRGEACCSAIVDPVMSEDNRWSLYVWDRRRMKWMPQENYTSLPLEQALTALLRWKSEGQIVRMDSVSGLL